MQEDLPRARASFERVLALSIPFFAVLSALLVLHARAIVLVALGPKWMDTIPVAQILFCALVPRCTYKVSESLAFAFGRSGAAAVRQGLFAAMIIGGSIVGARFGAPGVAVAASLSITAFYVVSMGFAARLVGLRGWSLALAHLRAAVLAACVGGADFLVGAFVEARLGFWPGELAGAAVGGIAVLALFCTIPRAWLGHDLSTLRAQLRARLPRFASGPTQS
jgi:PST family polysaccharide transporter